MKKAKKLLSLLLTGIMSVSLLAGCGENDENTLVMGLDVSFPPMGFNDSNGELVGFDVDLAKAVAEKMGVELKLQAID